MARTKRRSKTSAQSITQFNFLDLVADGAVLASLYMVLPFAPLRLERYVSEKNTLLSVMTLLILAVWLIKLFQGWRPNWRNSLKNPIVIGSLVLFAVTILSNIFSLSPVYSFIGKARGPNGTVSHLIYLVLMFQGTLSIKRIRPFIVPSISLLIFVQLIWSFFSLRISPQYIISTAGNPNYLSSWLLLAVFILSYEIYAQFTFEPPTTTKRSRSSNSSRLYTYYLIVLLICALGMMLFAGGRAALLALIVGAAGTVIMLGIAQNRNKLVFGTIAISASLIVAFIAIASFVPSATDYLRVFRLSDVRRFNLWDGGTTVIEQFNQPLTDYSEHADAYTVLRPMIGYGSDMVFQLQGRWASEGYYVDNVSWTHHMHLLDTIIEKGILGVLAWGIIILGAAYLLLKEMNWISINQIPFFAILLGLVAIAIILALVWIFPNERWQAFVAIGVGLAVPATAYLWVLGQGFRQQREQLATISLTKELVFLIFAVNLVMSHWIDLQFSFAQTVSEPLFWFVLGWIIYQTMERESVEDDDSAIATEQGAWVIGLMFCGLYVIHLYNVSLMSASPVSLSSLFAVLVCIIVVAGAGYWFSPNKDTNLNWRSVSIGSGLWLALLVIGYFLNSYLAGRLDGYYLIDSSEVPTLFFLEASYGIFLLITVVVLWLSTVWENIEAIAIPSAIILVIVLGLGIAIYALDFVSSAVTNLSWQYMSQPDADAFEGVEETTEIMEGYIVFPQDLVFIQQFARFFAPASAKNEALQLAIDEDWQRILADQPYFANSQYGQAFIKYYFVNFNAVPPQP